MYKYFFFIIAIIIGINSSCSNHNKPKDVSLVTQMEAVPKNDLPQFIDSIADGILNVVNPKAYSIFLESIKKQLVNDDAELRISLIYLEAEIERIQGNNNRALKKLLESLPYFEKSDGETTKIKILNLIGYLFQQKSTDFQSFDSYLKTFSNQERPEKLKELALLSRYLSAHYLKKEDSIKSIKYAKREVAIYTELNDFQSIRDAKIKLAE
ncbi:MAG: hypothetical protein RBR35_00085 [Salinivirgaceae bacterium]|nr:hypothetical protein [Salinivirgaceae bacterium]